MITKKVQCPKCNYVISTSGNPGDVVQITCPSCGNMGKITFRKIISDDGNAIEVSNLRKVYKDLVAVNDISFSIKKGVVFAFLGPNGAGKTTTVEMIESIRQPTSGKIKILGKDISTSFNDVKDKIGILPQEFHSYERLTVRETLDYYSKLYDQRANIDEIIKLMDLTSHKNMLYKNLSGGLKQRVGVAIALVNNPEIIFLDEPTTGLDPKAGLKKQGKTIFLTTHYMEEAEYLADNIAIIHKGKIIAEGTLDELINKYGSGTTLHIKNCKEENAVEMLKEMGYNAARAGNGNIAIKIDYKDKVLEILSNLRHDCIDYDAINIKQSNLEEVFLNLTGSKLAEEAA